MGDDIIQTIVSRQITLFFIALQLSEIDILSSPFCLLGGLTQLL